MQTVEWTDGKLEDRLDRIDERFKQIDKSLDRLEGDVREVKLGLAEVQSTLNRFVISAATGWVVLMGTIFIKGG